MAVNVSIVPPASTSVSIGGETTTSVSIAKGTEGLIEFLEVKTVGGWN